MRPRVKRNSITKVVKWYEITPWILIIAVVILQYANTVISAGGDPTSEYILFNVLPAEFLLVLLFIFFTLFLIAYAYFFLDFQDYHGWFKNRIAKLEANYSKPLPKQFDYKKFGYNFGVLAVGLVKLIFIYSAGAIPFVYLADNSFIGIPKEKLLALPIAILSLIFCYRLAKKMKVKWAEELRSLLVSFLYLGLITDLVVGYGGKPIISSFSLSNITLIVAFLDLALIESGFISRLKSKFFDKTKISTIKEN